MAPMMLTNDRYYKELKQYYNNNASKLNMREMFEKNDKRFNMFRFLKIEFKYLITILLLKIENIK